MNCKKVICGLAVLCSFGNLANAEEIRRNNLNIEKKDAEYIEKNNK